ncbi:MAG: formate/nitrite transporter FocA (FNT family) [Bacteriovoracaceae bacterium]|jgi:formate/nitrite transporter FocA (FNT family)
MNKTKNTIILDGLEEPITSESQTTRTIERNQEDEDYVPVILKRSDEALRHPDDTLEQAILEGIEQHKRPILSLFLSAIAAGLILGFTGMSVALVSQLFPGEEQWMLNRIVVALVYPLGFIICIMSGTQLFTEHTATAVYPVLDRKVHLKSLFILWVVVMCGNITGTFLSSLLIYFSDSVILGTAGFISVSDHLLSFSFGEVLMSAILAGWLMAQAGWLVLATPHASSQIVCVYIVTFIIGLGGLHHSIAGSAEIFSGIFHSESPNYLGAFSFLISALVGNLIGGSFFVGVLNYGHIKKTQ